MSKEILIPMSAAMLKSIKPVKISPASGRQRLLLKLTPWAALLMTAGTSVAQETAPAPAPVPPPANAPAQPPPAAADPVPVPAGPADITAPPLAPGDTLIPGVPAGPDNSLMPDLPPEAMLPFSTTPQAVEKRRAIPYSEASKGQVDSQIEAALDEVSARRISLMDAVRIALLNDPLIRLAGEEVAIAEASRQIAAGLFDARLSTGVSYAQRHAEMSEAEVAQNQEQFDRNNALIKATRREKAKIKSDIRGLEAGIDPPADTKEGQLRQEQNNAALDVLRQLGVAQGIDFNELDRKRDEINKQGIETRKEVLDVLQETEQNARKQNKQFPVISMRRTDTMTYDISVIKQFRNGIALTPYLQYDNSQNNVSRRGGGRRVNRSEMGLDLTIPLGRGRGTIAASGQEMAAEIDIEASQLSLQHTVAERVTTVASAYWNVAAAQEQLAFLVRSEITNSALVGLTDALIKADQVPRSGAAQPRASYAQSMAQRLQAEISLQEAQQSLALAMGVHEEGIIYAPLAGDPLPSIIPEGTVGNLSVSTLSRNAFAYRADYRAARKSIDSGKLLAEQARLNVKPRVDLSLSAFYTGRDEDGSRDSVYHLYTENTSGPGFAVALRMDWPFFLNEAKGTHALREANLASRREQMQLIDNGIVSGISRSWFALKLTARQLQRQEEAVKFYEQALGTERERFRLGTATLLDAIETEERLTLARAQLVNTRLQNALALVRLRFETGTLMPHDVAGSTTVARENFVTLPVFGVAPVDDAIAPRSGLQEAKNRVLGETDPHRVLRKIYAREAAGTPKDAAEAAVRRAAATTAPGGK
ncbi:MAG: TolC family protein [Verrucomicrobiota bacterium]